MHSAVGHLGMTSGQVSSNFVRLRAVHLIGNTEKSGRKIVQYTCLVKLSMKFCLLFGTCKIMQLEKYRVKLSLESARTVSSTSIYFNCKISENI